MNMHPFQCPSCSNVFSIPEHYLGKSVSCPNCRFQFLADKDKINVVTFEAENIPKESDEQVQINTDSSSVVASFILLFIIGFILSTVVQFGLIWAFDWETMFWKWNVVAGVIFAVNSLISNK